MFGSDISLEKNAAEAKRRTARPDDFLLRISGARGVKRCTIAVEPYFATREAHVSLVFDLFAGRPTARVDEKFTFMP